MQVYPVLYLDNDYYIDKNGNIYTFKLDDVTSKFSLAERLKIMAICTMGNCDLIPYLRDPNVVSLKSIYYYINPESIVYLDNDNILIDKIIFKRIPGLKYYYISENGVVYSVFYKKILHHKVKKDQGYRMVSLVMDNGKRKSFLIHRLIMLTYKSITDDINHIDGRPWNNEIYNLEPTTDLDNIRHAMFTTLNRDNTWSINEIHDICYRLSNLDSVSNIYKLYNNKVSYTSFKVLCHHLINKSKFWKDVSTNYDMTKWVKSNIKYNDNIIHEVCRYLENGLLPGEIHKLTDIPIKYICEIKQRKYRRKISNQYNF